MLNVRPTGRRRRAREFARPPPPRGGCRHTASPMAGALDSRPFRGRRAREEMVSDGADVIDVGGESTRPGRPRYRRAEMPRVIPVIAAIAEHLAAADSVDTRSAAVAAAAVEAGADIVNDVSAGLADASMLPTVASLRRAIVLMHIAVSGAAPGSAALV